MLLKFDSNAESGVAFQLLHMQQCGHRLSSGRNKLHWHTTKLIVWWSI